LPRFLWALSFGNLVVGTGAFVIGGMIEPLAGSLGISLAKAGQLMTAYSVATALGGPLLMLVTARSDRRTLLLAAMASLIAANVISALAHSFEGLVWARVLMGVGGGIYAPVAAAVCVASVAPALRGKALSTTFAGVSFAYIVGVPFGAFAAYRYGWPVAFWAVALAATIAWVLLLKTPAGISAPPSDLSSFSRVLRSPRSIAAVSVTLVYFAAIFTVFSYVGAFLRDYAGVSTQALSPLLTAFGISALGGTFAGGWSADRFGATRTLFGVCALFALVLSVMWLVPGRTIILSVAFVIWGSIGFGMMTSQQTRLVAMAPADAMVLLTVNSAMIYLGTALGAAIGGGLLALGSDYRGLLLGALLLTGVVAVLIAVTESKWTAARARGA
jgi:MFS transporter, DHA1 family, inner membrane transport protein